MRRTQGAPSPNHLPTVAGLLAVFGVGAIVGVAFLAGLALLFVPSWRDGGVERAVGQVAVVDPGSADPGFTVWAQNDDGTPVRWDPCTPIEVVMSAEGAPVGAVADLERALEIVAEASGLRFSLLGETAERPSAARRPFQPDRYGNRWAPVLVAWSLPGRARIPLRDIDRGVSIPVAVGPEGDRTYVTGQVVLGVHRNDLEPGFVDREHSWGATLVHELGHLVGLGHVDDPDELMHVFPGEGPVEFGRGDLAGLRAVGAGTGCRPEPRPQPVQLMAPAE